MWVISEQWTFSSFLKLNSIKDFLSLSEMEMKPKVILGYILKDQSAVSRSCESIISHRTLSLASLRKSCRDAATEQQ